MEQMYPFDKNAIFLVTGGAGFIGSNICEKLVKMGLTVRCFDNLHSGKKENIAALEAFDNFSFIQGDIREYTQCLEACRGVDYVLHDAALKSVAESMQYPEKYEEVNVAGTENLLKAAMECGVKKFVYASSAAVYGDTGKRILLEGEEGLPASVYGKTKKKNEQQAKRYTEEFGLDTYGLRYFNVYGKRQRPESGYSAVVPSFAEKIMKGMQTYINGDGLQTRDFVYIDDIVQANLKACLADSSCAGEIFNIGSGIETSILDLHRYIMEALGADQKPEFRPAVEGDVRYSCADISKAGKVLGYEPQYTFEDGIKASVQWYKENI